MENKVTGVLQTPSGKVTVELTSSNGFANDYRLVNVPYVMENPKLANTKIYIIYFDMLDKYPINNNCCT